MNETLSHIIDHPEIDEGDLKLVKSILPGVRDFLDIGFGTGAFLIKLKRSGLRGVGIDINPRAVNEGKKRGLKVWKRDGQRSGFKNEYFDVVRAKDVLEHLDKPQRLVAEVRRILKKRGLFVIHVPTQFSTVYPITNFWDDYTHIRPFTRRAIRQLLTDNDFKIILIEGYTIGRNTLEKIIVSLLGKVFPFGWRVVAQK
ncbi:MAG: Methyltransferase type 11 [Candidatus Nomurabacteria bacterium GW2011_GWA1_46_11]|uniref:Methyltransferase type 11 n=1 Tax=Candidatus Nomurabacteria bacterium GW2011_GWA1_46_11 TaxID=1618732 RepID=A0A0G1NNQ5_9BACT|nr:MAG: Methyltransferase type 11 [Microgenomates group bacterium GW2011_GWA2_44_7]KKT78041.1 MAG: Methyltransferase type 11 [Microgenomates group bacterium GW2011_GWB1_44_8]KKU21962.1 MAG: Methyltransferase type 11 [Candidatus Nomurabacteria bacterium GW2011_GWA1_46_11]